MKDRRYGANDPGPPENQFWHNAPYLYRRTLHTSDASEGQTCSTIDKGCPVFFAIRIRHERQCSMIRQPPQYLRGPFSYSKQFSALFRKASGLFGAAREV